MKKIILLICIFSCSSIFGYPPSYESQMRYLLGRRNIVEVEISSFKETPIENHRRLKIEVSGRILTVYRGDKKLLGRYFKILAFWTDSDSPDYTPMHLTKKNLYVFFFESIDKDGKLELVSIESGGYGLDLSVEAYEGHIIQALKNDKRTPFEMIRVQPYPHRKHYGMPPRDEAKLE